MRSESDRGQSTVELALVLPAVVVVMLAITQIGLLVQAQITATHAAREIARVLAVSPGADPYSALTTATNMSADRVYLDVSISPAGLVDREIVEVSVRYEVPLVSSALSFLDGDIDVAARAAMLVEN